MEKNCRGDTAFHIAARAGNSLLVKLLINSTEGVLGVKSETGNTALHEALQHHHVEHPLLRIVNKEGNTVLHEALINRCKQEEVVEILIKADPQVAYDPNKEGKSPLYLAAEARYFHVVEAIGKSKVEEHMNREAKPAVHGAILGKNKGQSNFGLYQRDDEGFLPIHVASMRGYVDVIKELLQVSFDSIELLSKHGENILHVAAKYGKDNVVNFVLRKKGLENLINEKDKGGNTPLHLATMHAHPKVVNYLTWDKRVDVNLVNNMKATAFDIAVSVEHPTSFHQTNLDSTQVYWCTTSRKFKGRGGGGGVAASEEKGLRRERSLPEEERVCLSSHPFTYPTFSHVRAARMLPS
ncbi:unnamed protein product, partial [Vitis vinifera]